MAPRKRAADAGDTSRKRGPAAAVPPPPRIPPEDASREEIVEFYKEVVEYGSAIRQVQEALLQQEGRHAWGLTNPLLFPAREYTQGVLKANQPFVRIVEKKPQCAVASRKPGRDMPPDVVKYVMRKTLSARLVDTEALYEDRDGEMTNRPWHLALIEGLRRLTTPSRETRANVADIERLCRSLRDETTCVADDDDDNDDDNDDDDDDDDYVAPTGLGDDEFEDMAIQPKQAPVDEDGDDDEAEADDDAPSLPESMRQTHEEDSNDIAVKVRFAKSKKDIWYTVLVVECKHSKTFSDDSIYQAIKYGVDRALKNLELGRVLPVHVVVVTESEWTYGVLDVYGAVKVGGDRKLIYDGFADFEKARWMDLNPGKEFRSCPRTTKKTLEDALERGRLFLRENARLLPGIEYPAGTYLVADLFLTRKKLSLPKATSVEAFHSFGALRFYETMLRIIVGNRVLTWTKADVRAALNTRDSLTKRMVDAITAVTQDSDDEKS